MRASYLLTILELRRSYWFWPMILVIIALAAGIIMPRVDMMIGDLLSRDTLVMAMGPGTASAALTMIASSVLGVAGVAFSLTMVAVSFAGANYGPRIIGNFMGDRINQVVFGILVATFAYAMIALRAVISSDVAIDPFVPQLTVILAMALAVVSVAALITFIHHVPESINVMNIVGSIGYELRRDIIALYEEEDRDASREEPAVAHARALAGEGLRVGSPVPGYIQYVELADLRKVAADAGAQIVLCAGPGDFVAVDEPLVEIIGGSPDDAVLSACRKAFSLGKTRTKVQDVLFLSDQLVEIVGRALSPSLNDPHTAILCIDWLRDALSAFAERPPLPEPGRDGLVIYRRLSFDRMAARSFRRMRQYVTADRTVTVKTLDALSEIGIALHDERQRALILQLVDEYAQSAAERLEESMARQEVETAANNARRRIAETG